MENLSFVVYISIHVWYIAELDSQLRILPWLSVHSDRALTPLYILLSRYPTASAHLGSNEVQRQQPLSDFSLHNQPSTWYPTCTVEPNTRSSTKTDWEKKKEARYRGWIVCFTIFCTPSPYFALWTHVLVEFKYTQYLRSPNDEIFPNQDQHNPRVY